MSGTEIKILDTGKRNVADSGTTWTQMNSGTWINLKGFTLSGDFTNNITANDALSTNSSDTSLLTFSSNEKTMNMAPRFLLRGLVGASETSTMTNIVNLGRKKAVLKMKGGLGFIAALPEYSDGVYVLIKNINFSETMANDTANVNFTINLEQVQ